MPGAAAACRQQRGQRRRWAQVFALSYVTCPSIQVPRYSLPLLNLARPKPCGTLLRSCPSYSSPPSWSPPSRTKSLPARFFDILCCTALGYGVPAWSLPRRTKPGLPVFFVILNKLRPSGWTAGNVFFFPRAA